ncbi:hypothetical protein [Streptomyces sp. NPDC058542]|uniref:hypothetical protein n=1 Tax=Streptomyces sp. NPDC058542 TaxID=3346543 RepID=UPI00365FE9BC
MRRSTVYGLKGDGGHERVHATVVTAPGAGVTADGLRAWCVRGEGRGREGRGVMYEPDGVACSGALRR